MITFEYSDTFAYPAANVFAALTDIHARPSWQPDLIEARIDPAGTARPGAQVFEVRKIAGRRSETTFIVSAFEQDQRLTLETPAGGQQRISESYWIEPLPGGNCRLNSRAEIDGVPRIAQFFVHQTMTKSIPQYFERLKSVIASRS